jgi:hypothetical protein
VPRSLSLGPRTITSLHNCASIIMRLNALRVAVSRNGSKVIIVLLRLLNLKVFVGVMIAFFNKLTD